MEIKSKYDLYDEVLFIERLDNNKKMKGSIFSIRIDKCVDKEGKEVYEIMGEDRLFHWCRLEDIIGQLKEKQPKRDIWKPKIGEEFSYIDTSSATYTIQNDGSDDIEELIECGNVFQGDEKAEFEAQREKYTRLFRQYVEQHSEPLDWSDVRKEKWYVFYDWELKHICFNYICGEQGIEVYGSSEEVMREAVEFVGEENVKKYVLGVESE